MYLSIFLLSMSLPMLRINAQAPACGKNTSLTQKNNNLILFIKWPPWLGGSGRVDERGWASSTVSLPSTRRSHVQIEM